MTMPPIVSPEEWEAARQELLMKEKEFTRARDALAPSVAGCRGWPWRRTTGSRASMARWAYSTCSRGAVS